jgi:hypothetical protein
MVLKFKNKYLSQQPYMGIHSLPSFTLIPYPVSLSHSLPCFTLSLLTKFHCHNLPIFPLPFLTQFHCHLLPSFNLSLLPSLSVTPYPVSLLPLTQFHSVTPSQFLSLLTQFHSLSWNAVALDISVDSRRLYWYLLAFFAPCVLLKLYCRVTTSSIRR